MQEEVNNLETLPKENTDIYKKALSDVPITQEKICKFHLKTGCCRYGDFCSKKHLFPQASQTILFKNMFRDSTLPKYSKIALLDSFRKRKTIEWENEDLYNDLKTTPESPSFSKFFCDIYPEFQKFGEIKLLMISKNLSPHLRGNVYIGYKTISQSLDCYKHMNGRYYAGLPLLANFCFFENFKDALCGYRFQCPRALECNFLHVYQNPRNFKKRSRSPRKNLYQ